MWTFLLSSFLTLTTMMATMPFEASAQGSAAPCNPTSKTFTVKLDIYTSELGYYTIEECCTQVNFFNDTATTEIYTFIQKDPSNFYHPMGFAYYPDGAHADKDELEPGVMPGNSSSCIATLSCPAPIYMLNGEPLGTYSNDANISAVTTGDDNFGLDEYEPRFFHPIAEWVSYGEFSIKLNFNEDYDKDIFYFCHVSCLFAWLWPFISCFIAVVVSHNTCVLITNNRTPTATWNDSSLSSTLLLL